MRNTFIFCLLAAVFLLAPGLHGSSLIEVDGVLDPGSPEAVAVLFVRAASEGRFDDARALMTEEYIAWLSRLSGGVDKSLSKYLNADLERRFAYRVIRERGKVTVRIRFYSGQRGREMEVLLNATQTSEGWRLTSF